MQFLEIHRYPWLSNKVLYIEHSFKSAIPQCNMLNKYMHKEAFLLQQTKWHLPSGQVKSAGVASCISQYCCNRFSCRISWSDLIYC